MPKSRKRKRSSGAKAAASGSGDVNWGGAASKGGVSTKLVLGLIAALA
ncbi:MAG: hypothetical protein HOF70_08385, partial [Rhodospirillaceae bacterium]|nr:hypothetical protein [Rhodospirillaceae bacterium]